MFRGSERISLKFLLANAYAHCIRIRNGPGGVAWLTYGTVDPLCRVQISVRALFFL